MTPGLVCLCQYHTAGEKEEEERGERGREKTNEQSGQQDVSAMQVNKTNPCT